MTNHDPHPTPSTSSLQATDLEKQTKPLEQQDPPSCHPRTSKESVYAGLGWLDRLLVLWILLAIIIGILLGNYVPSVGPALQKGKFVQVSVPIGEFWPSQQRYSVWYKEVSLTSLPLQPSASS